MLEECAAPRMCTSSAINLSALQFLREMIEPDRCASPEKIGTRRCLTAIKNARLSTFGEIIFYGLLREVALKKRANMKVGQQLKKVEQY